MNKKRPLNEKEKAFVRAYINCNDVVTAYHTAGYNQKKTEYNIKVKAKLKLSDPRLQEYLESTLEQERKLGRLKITQDRIIEMLQEDRDFAIKCEAPAAAISATKLLGQALGMLKNSAELISHNVNNYKAWTAEDTATLSIFTIEQLRELAKKLEKEDNNI